MALYKRGWGHALELCHHEHGYAHHSHHNRHSHDYHRYAATHEWKWVEHS